MRYTLIPLVYFSLAFGEAPRGRSSHVRSSWSSLLSVLFGFVLSLTGIAHAVEVMGGAEGGWDVEQRAANSEIK